MRRWLFLVVLLLCAASSAATAIAADADDVAGVWVGVVTGREMASAGHILSDPARLAIDRAGRFVLIEGATISTGQITPCGANLCLDGEVTAPASRAGERMSHRLRRHRDGMFGRVTNVFSGNRITVGAALRRADAG